MRADTFIKSWEQLKGRTVCVARDGRHVGAVASRSGAVEKIYPSLTDALIALRSGACDATVHDSAMLEELIRLPEWKKFSARLPAGQDSTLAFLVPAADSATLARLRQVANDWKAEAYPDALMKKAVRNIAFEVYLEQDVPDCH
jgi:polar amino acid transport system substrate-binding protein